jgi:inner membrane protein
MHVVTHLLVGWTLAEHTVKVRRDKALVAWASVVPDADGIGLPVDWVCRALGYETAFYEQFHRVALHGLPGAVFITFLFVLLARERLRAAPWIFISYHLHLLGDVLGSRGSGPMDIWPIHYLSPLSDALTVAWTGQWPLTSWQNTTVTIVLMAYAVALAIRRGYSPVGLFSARADASFVETLRARWRALRGAAR